MIHPGVMESRIAETAKNMTWRPDRWTLKGFQHDTLKTWRTNVQGRFVNRSGVSDLALDDLELDRHRSTRIRLGIREDAGHRMVIRVFGRGVGSYDHLMTMRLKD